MSLKNILSVLALSLFTSGAAFAQPSIDLGAKLGLGLTKYTGSAVVNSGYGFGYSIGPAASFSVAPGFAIATEVTFARRAYSTTAGTVKTSSKVWDISVPVLARYNVIPMLFAQAGLSLSYGVGSVSTQTGTNPSQSTPYFNTTTNPTGTKRMDLGLVFGAGTSLPLPTGSLLVDARFNLGLSNRQGAAAGAINTASRKTMGMELAATYLF